MKNRGKFFRVAALCALMLCFLPLNAQNTKRFDNKYYISAWGALGYANLLHGDFYVPSSLNPYNSGIPHTSAVGGAGGLLGVGFEYNHKRFILTFGAEFDYKLSITKAKDFRMEVGEIVGSISGLPVNPNDPLDPNIDGVPIIKPGTGMIDTEGDPFAMKFNFSNYRDIYHVMYVNFPLLMGAQFANRFYFLAGGKVGLYFGRESYVNTAYNTVGTYPQFIEDFHDMIDHYFSNYRSPDDRSVPNRNVLDFGLNVVASLEMGKVFVPKKGKAHYRIAAFADYGFLNIHKNLSYGNPINFLDNPVLLQHNAILASDWAWNKSVNPLLVGVKFTVLLDLGNKEPCVCIEPYKTKWQNQKNTRSRSIDTIRKK